MFGKNYLAVIKVSVVVLSVSIVTLVAKLYSFESQIKELNESIELDKKIHNNEINEILIRYDSVLIKNMRLEKESSLNTYKATDSNAVYDTSIKKLKGSISILEKNNTSKEKRLANLNSILKTKQIDLESNKEEILNLNSKIAKLQTEIKRSVGDMELKKLKAKNVSAIGSKVVSEKILETKRLKGTEKIKVCFTLEDNPSVEKGDKDIFIQIINPKSNIVSKAPAVLEIKNKTLFYSAKTTINYAKENVDVCVLVDAHKNNLIKGNYIVNIFSGINLIGNTNLILN